MVYVDVYSSIEENVDLVFYVLLVIKVTPINLFYVLIKDNVRIDISAKKEDVDYNARVLLAVQTNVTSIDQVLEIDSAIENAS